MLKEGGDGMIYFEMIDTPVLVCAPRLVGWPQAFDVRNIRIDISQNTKDAVIHH